MEELVALSAAAAKAAAKAAALARKSSEAASEAARAASEAARAAARAARLAAAAASKAASEVLSAADENLSDTSSEPDEPPRNPKKPLGAFDIMKLLSRLGPDRTGPDRLRVGVALRHNALLLRRAGRAREADIMATFYDVISMRCLESYPGRQAVHAEFDGLREGSAGFSCASLLQGTFFIAPLDGRLFPAICRKMFFFPATSCASRRHEHLWYHANGRRAYDYFTLSL